MAEQPQRRSGGSGSAGVWRQLLGDGNAGASRGVTTRAAAAASSSSQQTRQQAQSPAPEARSGHAMTLLRPSGSMLLFGGSDGKIFYNDFYVLEPTQYAALGATQESSGSEISLEMSAVGEIAGLSQSSTGSCDDEHNASTEHDDDATDLSLQWKQLVVTYAPAHYGTSCFRADTSAATEEHLPSSFDSDDSDAARAGPVDELPYVGGGRDYHSMHYIPASRDEEAQRGMRVLVLGNILVAAEDDAKRFEIDEFRIEEVRVRQPMLEAQWVPQRFTSRWKPRPRQAHSSVLVGDQLFCFGGKNAATTEFFNDIFYFDVRRNEWHEPPSTGSYPAPRSYAGMAATHDKIFMYGGYDGRQQFGGIYVYDVALSRWDKVAATGDKPTARMNHSLTYLPPHHLIMFGGREHSSRQNDLSLFDITTETWTQLSPDSNARKGGNGRTSRNSSSSASASTSSSSLVSAATPLGRTAHAAVHYDLLSTRARSKKAPLSERILIFGGYGGSLKWLNDLQLLTIPSDVLTPSVPAPSVAATAGLAEHHVAASSGLSTALLPFRDDKIRSQSAPAQCSQYSQQSRPPSRNADTPSVLTDITNQTQTSGVTATSTVASAGAATTQASSSSSKRQHKSTLAGLSTLLDSTTDTRSQSLTQSSQTRESKRRKRQGESQDASLSSSDFVASASQVGTHTAFIQLLQHSERLEEGLGKVLSILAQEQALRRHDHDMRVAFASQVETLEQQLRAADQKVAVLEKKLDVSEAEKLVVREQLVAADAELFVYRQAQTAPKFKDEILEAIQQSNRYQFAASNLLENKLASIHDTLEEIRHFSGERTETDDSPQKKNSMFPDDESKSQASQPHLYPERVVINLEERLRSALASNEELVEKLRATEAKLKRAEGTSERIRQLSLAWMHESDAQS